MIDKIKKEIKELIKKYSLNYTIKEFEGKINWFLISALQTLSEDFIRKFKNKVDWECISYSQKLSENFIREFKNKLDLEYLLRNNRISQSFYDFLLNEKVNRFELIDI